MYREVDPGLSFPERESKILEFWRNHNIFEQSMEERRQGAPYIFYDGPPTANGTPHIGHVLTRVVKDLIPRYRTMKGYSVPRKAGWDTHGLPVELEVEKQLGLDGKQQIEEYGIAPFVDRCKESVWKYRGMWEEFSGKVGFWADMDNPYVTYHNDFIESEWWALKKIFDRGLLYKGFKIVPYCPRCGTPLSSHEVAQGYKDVEERTAFVGFRLRDEDACILAWTTTPWTLPSNVALCVNPAVEYARVSKDGNIYYLARELAETVLGECQVLDTFPGTALEHREYEPLFPIVSPREKCWYITCDNYVTTGDGTGVVHIAPAFGEDDAKVGRRYGLPLVQLVDEAGRMKPETPWPGVFCKDADELILRDLQDRGLLLSTPVHTHSYPFCWRCDTPLIYYARESWFIETTAVKDELIANNNTVNWIPPNMGTGRFGDWLENLQDWSISRDRYWGTPLNVWECACGHRHCVGSIEELRTLSGNCPEDIELHRPYIDAVTLCCPSCGGEMHRVPEVIDCWFDSGAMPFAQHHYPFENRDLFEREFPADFISEAVDQTRGWFYSLLAVSTLVFGVAPYKNVLVLGHVLDKDGQKMSKSKGNAVEPMEALEQYGADAIRWYFTVNSAPWLPNRFHGQAVLEGQRKFLGTLWNTYAFYILYARLGSVNPLEHSPRALSAMDRWALSRLHRTTAAVDDHLEHYRITEAARLLQEFVDDLSNWYVRRSRSRFWSETPGTDEQNAFWVLHTALVTTAKLCAPFIPFLAEELYRNLVCSLDPGAPESVHLCDFPRADEALMDTELETAMETVRGVVTLGRAARNGAGLKTRQPLSRMLLCPPPALSDELVEIAAQELNVKQVSFAEDLSDLLDYSLKPQLKTVGPKFGKQVGAIRAALAGLDGAKAKAELERTRTLRMDLPGGPVELSSEDILLESRQREGYFTVADGGITVALCTDLTPELLEEGTVRELISKLQTLRKEADFAVTDRIAVGYRCGEELAGLIARHRDAIASEVLAVELEAAATLPSDGFERECDINGAPVVFSVRVVQ